MYLGPKVDDWPAVERLSGRRWRRRRGVLTRILHRAPTIVENVDKIARDCMADGMDSRKAWSTGALSAGWHEWGLGTGLVYPDLGDESDDSLARDCLFEILNLTYRVDGHDQSIGSLLRKELRMSEVADQFGVKLLGTSLAIWAKHTGLRKQLRRTRWEKSDVTALLRQIPGVVEHPNVLRFGVAGRKRALLFDPEILRSLGLDLSPEAPHPRDPRMPEEPPW